MGDIIHEITRYAQRSQEPYHRWAEELSRLMIENAALRERIHDLEAAQHAPPVPSPEASDGIQR